MTEAHPWIEALLEEDRSFPPPPSFAEHALVADPEIYERAAAEPEAFWAEKAGELEWMRSWDTVLDWDPPFVKWFLGAR